MTKVRLVGMAFNQAFSLALLIIGIAVPSDIQCASLSKNEEVIIDSKTTDSLPDQASINWLQRFGYLRKENLHSGGLHSYSSFLESIRRLQRFAGLNETVKLDQETKILMQTSRCGMPDPSHIKKRKRRFALQGTTWGKKHLTWQLLNSNNDGLTKEIIESILNQAFSKWAQHSELTFSKRETGVADIKISFHTLHHNDTYPFDGPGGILAHAFYPFDNQGSSGDIHFDDDEHFTVDSSDGKNLYWIAVHEIGHALGLEHSSIKGAIMYPWYTGYHGNNFNLTYDDITGIQTLYGPPKSTDSTLFPPTTNGVISRVCLNQVKSVFLKSSGEMVIINNDKLYVIAKHLGLAKGPIPVNSYFSGIQSVDAAYVRPDNKIVLFSGKSFYIFDDTRKISGPTLIADHFKGFPSSISKIDAAFIWSGNGRTYLFTGSDYWRYNEVSRRIDWGYPRKIERAWRGVPNHVDAAFTWSDKKTYFFKGPLYYRITNSPMRVAYNFPKQISREWTQCRGELKTNNNNNNGSIVVSTSFSLTILMSFIVFISARSMA